MNKSESKQSQPQLKTNEGWIIQVYDSNRRLLHVLEPSHAWIFLAGCCMGLLISVIWVNAARYNSPANPTTPTEVPAFQVD